MSILYGKATNILNDSFLKFDHHPPLDQQEGLNDVLLHLSKMADGNLERKYFISSLDPGVGKTMAVISFLKSLSHSEGHKQVGALVGVSRKNEIRAIVKGLKSLGVPKESYAVLVSDYDNQNDDLHAMGTGDPETAQILLTTHQMIIHRCFEADFETVGSFSYHGSPRAVRIWDEGLLPAQPLCLSSCPTSGLMGQIG